MSNGQNILNTEALLPTPTPTSRQRDSNWVGPDWWAPSYGLPVAQAKEQWWSRAPLWEKKEKTEQRGLLSCLCVLTNQRQHTESLSQSPCRGLTATWLAVQAGYHLGGPSGSTEKGATGGISEWTKQADTGEDTRRSHARRLSNCSSLNAGSMKITLIASSSRDTSASLLLTYLVKSSIIQAQMWVSC